MPQFGCRLPHTAGAATPPLALPLDGPVPDDRELVRAALVQPATDDPLAQEKAAGELADRHDTAVGAYAARCTTTPAAAELLRTSAQRTAAQTFLHDGDLAWRPHLLNTVLHTAAAWSGTDARRHLVPGLLTWLEGSRGEIPAPVPADHATGEVPLLVAAFRGLPGRLQTVLWHVFVEGEDLTLAARCTGSSTAVVRRWSETVEDEFRAVYGRLYEESVSPPCRPYSRLVLTTARTGLDRPVRGAGELAGHVQGCEGCARAFREVSRLHTGQWAPLLAQELLPWEGRHYRQERAGARLLPEVRAVASAHEPAPWRGERRLWWAAVAVAVVLAVSGAALMTGGAPDPAPETRTANAVQHGDKWNHWTSSSPPRPGGLTDIPASAPPPKPGPARSSGAGKPSPSPEPAPPARLGHAQAALRWDFRTWGARPKDTSSFGRPGEYHGYVDWRPDREGSVFFDGKSHVQTTQAVLDTSRSFTVALWARPRPGGGDYTLAAQDGANVSGFLLRYSAADDRWHMTMGGADSADAPRDDARSSAPAAPDGWQHLTGVYDAGKRQLRLYVNGTLQGTASHTSAWRANGPFTVGRGQRGGTGADLFRGYLDDVRAFQDALTPSRITGLASAAHNH
ncbi:LamG-like jellyroll fold domain-containing protein [Streptomyces sp. NPDC007984]|uniref:LamG-like jellyroll fold domain-containing protein n=1 Tax=Streptomyces sp. NPDC007984 TaxID=3364801 RepID=UPI0036E6C06C